VNSWRDGDHDFADLLRAAAAVEGLLRIRYTSPHPSDFSERMIDALAECPKVCPHVHLPLQSGSDTILAAMNRTYTVAEYRAVLERVRARVPAVALSTDTFASTGLQEPPRVIRPSVLACTHYPLIAPLIADIVGPAVKLIDSGAEAARATARLLRERGQLGAGPPRHQFFVSDERLNFARIAQSFLGGELPEIHVVDQTDLPWYERPTDALREERP
jgi:hypothetical protein